jgi:hypothetical protein
VDVIAIDRGSANLNSGHRARKTRTARSLAFAALLRSNGRRDVSATVELCDGLLGRHIKGANTGTSTVSTVVANHALDAGSSIHRLRAIDTYFEVSESNCRWPISP